MAVLRPDLIVKSKSIPTKATPIWQWDIPSVAQGNLATIR